MNRGEVVYCPNFRFKDGGRSPKLLVVIGSAPQGTLVFRTTSQEREDRPATHGCHVDYAVFRFSAPCAPFEKPTWVQYEDPYVVEENDDAIGSGSAVVCKLSPEQIQAIINCFRKSQEFTTWLAAFCVG